MKCESYGTPSDLCLVPRLYADGSTGKDGKMGKTGKSTTDLRIKVETPTGLTPNFQVQKATLPVE